MPLPVEGVVRYAVVSERVSASISLLTRDFAGTFAVSRRTRPLERA